MLIKIGFLIDPNQKRDHYRNRKHSFTCPKRAGNRCRRSDCRAGTYRYAYPFP